MKILEKYIEMNKIRGVISAVVLILFLTAWELLPKSFSSTYTHVEYVLVLVLCVLSGVKIKGLEKYQGIFCVILLLVSPAVCLFDTEVVVENPLRDMTFLMVTLNYAIYFLGFLVLYVLTNRIRIAVPVGMTVFTIYSLANSFVLEFRGYGIRTSDVYAIQTAMNVSKGYELTFTYKRADIILIALMVVLIAIHCEYRTKGKGSRILAGFVTLCYMLALYLVFWNDDFMTDNYIKPYQWEITASAEYHGAFLDFCAGIPYLSVESPQGYSEAKAKEIEQTYMEKESDVLSVETDLNGKKPDVIVIMNESFSDLTRNGGFTTDQPYLEYFESLQENVIRGYTGVPVFGGLTANSEFEFMTGFSNAFFPTGVMAYQNYVKDSTPNLNDWMKEQGYYSIFMHPMSSSGWNRKNVYESFGFDEAYYLSDWLNKEYIRSAISDRSDYKDLIQRYEDAKEENEQVFLFNVTMQNHGGYMDAEYGSSVHITDMEGYYPQTEQYLSLMKESDQALRELIAYFSEAEDPVLICMFGDHQPSVEQEFYDELQSRSGNSEVVKLASQHQTPFILYANYDIEEQNYENISLNYLQVLLMEAAGLPLTDYQSYLKGLYEEYPVVNVNGTMDKEGNWYDWTQAEELEAVKGYSIVQYWQLFGGGK